MHLLERMKLSAFTDYSLRLLMYLAAEPSRRATIAEVAQAFDIAENHLSKVAHALGRAGWLANVRGKGGGLRLARPPQQIAVGDVVRKMETDLALVECFHETSRCLLTSTCQLKGVLGAALEAFFASLDKVALSEVLGPSQRALLHVLKRMP